MGEAPNSREMYKEVKDGHSEKDLHKLQALTQIPREVLAAQD
jgi:hypothetical protein